MRTGYNIGQKSIWFSILVPSIRDALWFTKQGCPVVAVEPAADLRKLGQLKTVGFAVQWLDDSLPELKACYQLNLQFNTILLSAGWMHIPPNERERAFRKNTNLLAPGGQVILTLRYGVFTDERDAFTVSVDEIAALAKQYGLVLRFVSVNTPDAGSRDNVTWQNVVLELPDDGSGSLSKVQHIVINDSKASTYKLALLRTFVRIADAHLTAVLDKQDGNVTISLGLVALYWIRLFKRLVDNNIQQSSDPAKGLGFVKEHGWGLLGHLTADDFAIGNFYTGKRHKPYNSL